MKYIVAGPTIINDIVFYNKREMKKQIGGSVFCLAGIKLWSDDCLYVSNVGKDFSQYYGEWMDANDFLYDGLNYILPHTQYTKLIYGKNGLHDESSVYGVDMDEMINQIDIITAKQIADNCDSGTKGIYIEASEKDELWNNLDFIRSKCNAKIMWELPTSATMDESRKPKVLEIIKLVDIYSINLPEALSLFRVSDENEAVQAIAELCVPCFLRVGKRGSYMIDKGLGTFVQSIDVGELVDTTGCGNASTAAALYGFCEGFEPGKIAAAANISAAYNLLQYGPYTRFSPEIREHAINLFLSATPEAVTHLSGPDLTRGKL